MAENTVDRSCHVSFKFRNMWQEASPVNYSFCYCATQVPLAEFLHMSKIHDRYDVLVRDKTYCGVNFENGFSKGMRKYHGLGKILPFA